MYDNIGSKIKTLATACFVIAAIVSGIVGFVRLGNFIDDEKPLWAFLTLLITGLAIFFAWISTFLLYGFGQLIENSDILVKEAKKQQKNGQTSTSQSIYAPTPRTDIATEKAAQSMRNVASAPQTAPPKRCPLCGEIVTSRFCNFCGTENKFF